MKFNFCRWLLFGVLLILGSDKAAAIDPDLGSFLASKQQQIRELAGTITNKVPSTIWSFYEAIRVEDWESATNLAQRINQASRRYAQGTNDVSITPALATLIWPPISESYGAYEQFHIWNAHWLHRFGSTIITSIPPGSIYFGGTDPGRFIISALSESQVEGKPFFTLTQNQLADQTYLDYLRSMYGRKLHLPTSKDAQKAFEDYVADADQRRKLGQLKPGEDVRVENGRVQVSGQVAVMQINGLLVKTIFENNPDRQFFMEESFPLDWMNPHLIPHGLIFQLNRQPLAEFPPAVVSENQDFWQKLSAEALGGWLTNNTSIECVCAFAEKYGDGRRLGDYPGDKTFASNAQARKCFSKLRSAQAGVYAWRAQQAKDSDLRDRMNSAADLAFRQSLAICPYSPEVIYRYVNLLLARNQTDNAVQVAQTAVRVSPEDEQFKSLLKQLKQYRL